jgi:hypothetical protein
VTAGAVAGGGAGAATGAVAVGAGTVAWTVTGVFLGFAFFFVAWCVGIWLAVAVWVDVVATVEASPACLAFPPLVVLATMISATRPPSTVRTLWRRGHDGHAGRR